MAPSTLRRHGPPPGSRAVREGLLDGGLPYLAFGQGPPLVVLPGFSAEHTVPTGPQRRFQLQPLTPLAAHFTVWWVCPKPGLPPGTTMADLAGHYARALERAFTGPVDILGISTGGHLLAGLLWLSGAWLHPRDPSGMLATIDAEDRFDAAAKLHRIGAPTLLVAGDRDRYYTAELTRETPERIPGARLRLYAGKGHAGIATLRHRPALGEILRFLTAGDP